MAATANRARKPRAEDLEAEAPDLRIHEMF